MRNDERGLALGIAALVLSLIVGAIIIWIVDMTTAPLLNHAANATTDTTANTATEWFRSYVGLLPGIFMVLALFGTIVYAVYTREF